MLEIGKVYKRISAPLFMFENNSLKTILSVNESITVVDCEKKISPIGSYVSYKFLGNNTIYTCNIGWNEVEETNMIHWEEIC